MEQNAPWFVTYVKPQNELKVVERLGRRGYETFLPMSARWAQRGHKRVEIERPLFPRYLFVRFGPGGNFLEIGETVGVVSILNNFGKPGTVRNTFIADLRAAMIAGQFNEKPARTLQPGEAVKFMRGPFEGLMARIQGLHGTERAEVLLEILKSEIRVSCKADDLAAIA